MSLLVTCIMEITRCLLTAKEKERNWQIESFHYFPKWKCIAKHVPRPDRQGLLFMKVLPCSLLAQAPRDVNSWFKSSYPQTSMKSQEKINEKLPKRKHRRGIVLKICFFSVPAWAWWLDLNRWHVATFFCPGKDLSATLHFPVPSS